MEKEDNICVLRNITIHKVNERKELQTKNKQFEKQKKNKETLHHSIEDLLFVYGIVFLSKLLRRMIIKNHFIIQYTMNTALTKSYREAY